MKKLLFIIPLLYSCGDLHHKSLSKREIVESKTVFFEDSEFEYFTGLFQEAAELHMLNPVIIDSLIVKYGTLTRPAIASCRLSSSKAPLITIDKEYWDRASFVQKKVVMFHELGHCILKRDHIYTLLDFGPASIMYPENMSYYYDNHASYYDKELFSIYGDLFKLADEDYTWTCDGK